MTRADLALWTSIAADSVIINPPWDRLVGREACMMGLTVFFEHYKGTYINSNATSQCNSERC
jgi:hypothetical protein